MRKTFVSILLAIGLALGLATGAGAQIQSQQVPLLSGVITTGGGTAIGMGRTKLATASGGVIQNTPFRTFQAYGTVSTSTGAATILIQVSADGSNWLTACTITLTLGTAVTSDGCAMNAAWPLVRANVSALSGTNATITAYMGV